MTPERFRLVERIVTEILEAPRAERASMIERACGNDIELRREVVSLLRHDDESGSFLGTPALGASFDLGERSAATLTDELVGTSVGPYRIEERIGAGGMGVVYRATRTSADFSQTVALKVVKRGMDSDEVTRRFARERRTLASITHPGVARLYDGGTLADGRPYLVMELVDGVPIDDFCRDHALGMEDRIRLFLKVCDAAAELHQRLVVHRDLKPSNILVTPSGDPKLLDFGISSVLEAASGSTSTIASERRLTPQYASPELIRGEPVSTSTDVYSLGLLLYELVSGARPYNVSECSPAELERVVGELQPPLPSASAADRAIAKMLRGDLDTIVMAALHKSAARRYASVDRFADDLRRYLSKRPIRARPDSLGYRTRLFVRRNAVATVLTGVSVAALCGGVAAFAWQARIASAQRDEAYAARDESEEIASFFQRMLEEADPAEAGPNATIRSVLDSTASLIDGELGSRPKTGAVIRSALGRTYLALGLYEQAETHMRAAMDVRLRLLDPDHHDVAESKFDIAALRYAQGNLNEAEGLLREALASHERFRGTDSADTARAMNDLGAVLRAQNKIAEAQAMHERALAIRSQLFGPTSLEVAESLNNLAGVRRAGGDADGARDFLAQALNIRRERLRESHPLVAQSMHNLAVMVASQGDLDRAESLFREAMKSIEGMFDDTHPIVARTLRSLGNCCRLNGKFTDASAFLDRAAKIYESRLGATAAPALDSRVDLARALVLNDRIAEAIATVEDVRRRERDGGQSTEARDRLIAEIMKRVKK